MTARRGLAIALVVVTSCVGPGVPGASDPARALPVDANGCPTQLELSGDFAPTWFRCVATSRDLHEGLVDVAMGESSFALVGPGPDVNLAAGMVLHGTGVAEIALDGTPIRVVPSNASQLIVDGAILTIYDGRIISESPLERILARRGAPLVVQRMPFLGRFEAVDRRSGFDHVAVMPLPIQELGGIVVAKLAPDGRVVWTSRSVSEGDDVHSLAIGAHGQTLVVSDRARDARGVTGLGVMVVGPDGAVGPSRVVPGSVARVAATADGFVLAIDEKPRRLRVERLGEDGEVRSSIVVEHSLTTVRRVAVSRRGEITIVGTDGSRDELTVAHLVTADRVRTLRLRPSEALITWISAAEPDGAGGLVLVVGARARSLVNGATWFVVTRVASRAER